MDKGIEIEIICTCQSIFITEHDFHCTEAKDMNYKLLADRVRYFKETQKGRTTSSGRRYCADRSGAEKGILCVR